MVEKFFQIWKNFGKFFQIWKNFGKFFQIWKNCCAAVAVTVKTKSPV